MDPNHATYKQHTYAFIPCPPPPPPPSTSPKPGGVHDQRGAYLPPEKLKELGFAMLGDGLTDLAVSCANPTDQPLTLIVDPGTTCAPDDSAYQTMLVVGQCELQVPPHGTASLPLQRLASRSLIVSDAAPKGTTVPAVCTEFKKKVPRRSVTYTPGPCSDAHLLQLARFIASEPLGGPWDQGAAWIYTDRLTREEMNKRLLPGLSPWTYLRALHMAGEQAGVDYKDARWRGCLDPSLLLDEKDTDRDTRWFVETFARVDPRPLADWVEANLSGFTALSGPQASDRALKHVATVANALCAGPDQVRRAGIRLLLGGVAADRRAALTAQASLPGVSELLASDDPEVVRGGLDVAMAYGLRGLLPKILDLGQNGRTPEICAKAREADEALKGAPGR